MPSPTAFLDAVCETISAHKMVRRGDRILAAVSGGPDSLALISCLVSLRNRLGISLHAVYVNHGLRPAAAKKEEALVRRAGKLWGVPADTVRCAVRRKKGESLESAARRARYEALTRVARKRRCSAIALGHTGDDQAETVLMWLFRGAGTSGLAGIPPVRPAGGKIRIIRPMIRVTRVEISRYLAGQPLKPLLDRSNHSLVFLRNKIRRRLIPLLEKEYSPQLRRRLMQLAEIVREDLSWLESQSRKASAKTARSSKKGIRLDRSALRSEPASIRRGVLRLSVQRLQGNRNGFTALHWRMLDELLRSRAAGAIDLPHGLRAEAAGAGKMLLCRIE